MALQYHMSERPKDGIASKCDIKQQHNETVITFPRSPTAAKTILVSGKKDGTAPPHTEVFCIYLCVYARARIGRS